MLFCSLFPQRFDLYIYRLCGVAETLGESLPESGVTDRLMLADLVILTDEICEIFSQSLGTVVVFDIGFLIFQG